MNNYNLIDTFFIDQNDYLDFLLNKRERTIANDEATCFATLKKSEGCFLYTLTWLKDGKYIGDYIEPFRATKGNIEIFNFGCKIMAERLSLYIDSQDAKSVPNNPPAFGVLTRKN